MSLTLIREMFPESRPDKLIVTAVHPGVQPFEMEMAVTIKIEEAVRDVDGVEQVDSTFSESVTQIFGTSTTTRTIRLELRRSHYCLL